jgi:hypothetical protein
MFLMISVSNKQGSRLHSSVVLENNSVVSEEYTPSRFWAEFLTQSHAVGESKRVKENKTALSIYKILKRWLSFMKSDNWDKTTQSQLLELRLLGCYVVNTS